MKLSASYNYINKIKNDINIIIVKIFNLITILHVAQLN